MHECSTYCRRANKEFRSLKVKFGLSEKHTKLKKNLPHGFYKSADLLSKRQNHEEDFFQIMCASQKVRTLTLHKSG